MDLERVYMSSRYELSSIMNDGKEVPTRRATWMLKYKKASLETKFRDNILRNITGKAIKT